MPISKSNAILHGSLDLLVLQTLAHGPQHGYGIARHLRRTSADVFQVEEGSLYPALHRLERRRWIAADWGTSENNRRAKYYRLTPKGQKQLQAETTALEKIVAAIYRVLEFRPVEG